MSHSQIYRSRVLFFLDWSKTLRQAYDYMQDQPGYYYYFCILFDSVCIRDMSIFYQLYTDFILEN